MAKEMFVDYYAMFGLDRSMTEKEIKKALSQVYKELNTMLSCTDPDTETYQEIVEKLDLLQKKAWEPLTKPDKRKKYNAELDKAIKAGNVNKELNKEVQDLLERARKFYLSGKFEMAVKCAKQVLESNVNKPEPYIIISQSLFSMEEFDESIEYVDKGLDAYSDNETLNWLSVRYHTLIDDYDTAQSRLNEAVEKFGETSLFAAEQIYFYFFIDQFDMGRKLINEYIEKKPNDNEFRRLVAYNLISISSFCYLYDSPSEMYLITEEGSYQKCLELLTLANEIYQDEVTSEQLEQVTKFGEIEFDKENKGDFAFYCVFALIWLAVAVYGFSIGAVALGLLMLLFTAVSAAIDVIIYKLSRRPYWMIFRDEYRGFRETEDSIVYTVLTIPCQFVSELIDAFRY